MKANYKKVPGGTLVPADEECFELAQNLKNDDVYEITIKLNQNYNLHKKMFAFFNFCAQYYYGDRFVTKEQVELTRKNLLINAGYFKQVFHPNGKTFEVWPESLKYEKMPPEERSECYKALVSAAIKTIWNNQIDELTENQLLRFMF